MPATWLLRPSRKPAPASAPAVWASAKLNADLMLSETDVAKSVNADLASVKASLASSSASPNLSLNAVANDSTSLVAPPTMSFCSPNVLLNMPASSDKRIVCCVLRRSSLFQAPVAGPAPSVICLKVVNARATPRIGVVIRAKVLARKFNFESASIAGTGIFFKASTRNKMFLVAPSAFFKNALPIAT